jgi:MtfA peptidase
LSRAGRDRPPSPPRRWWSARPAGETGALPPDWTRRLDGLLKGYPGLPAEARQRLERRVESFVAAVPFEGCDGLEVVPWMRLVIATRASLLALGLPDAPYGRLFGVMLYPNEFWVEEIDEDETTGVVTEGQRALSGQTLDTDRIVLSWHDIEQALFSDDGYDVVVHEFAHYLDHAAAARGAQSDPAVRDAYHAHCAAVAADEETFLDPYGAEDPAEFFAVLAEAFIALPGELQQEDPALYGAMKRLLGIDPASWR